jgi:SAM-dependent methyltransferase
VTVDALRPDPQAALRAWRARVRADREQVLRAREVEDPADFYAPVADRFRMDPRRTGDAVLDALLGLVVRGERWLDIGAGGGRYALPLALRAGSVVCVEPSPALRTVLAAGAAEHGIGNIEVLDARWPVAAGEAPTAEVVLMAHIGYDIEEIGPFLDAAEAQAERLCVAVMGEVAMTTAASRFWERIHGEPRVALPALPELLTLLVARGRLPEVRLVDRVGPVFETVDDLHAMARRQLWLRPGSVADARLRDLVEAEAVERDGRLTLDRQPSSIGIVSWTPR